MKAIYHRRGRTKLDLKFYETYGKYPTENERQQYLASRIYAILEKAERAGQLAPKGSKKLGTTT